MNNAIYQAILASKYLGIGALMAIFPTESVMPFAGYSASQGKLSLPGAIIAATIGSTLGSTVLYAIARLFDKKTVNTISDKYGKWLGITGKRVEQAGGMFDRHAKTTVFWGRFVPGVRSAVSIPAGYRRMSPFTFLFCTLLGSGLCCTALGLLGYYAKTSINQIQTIAQAASYAVGVGVIIAVAGLYFWHQRRRT